MDGERESCTLLHVMSDIRNLIVSSFKDVSRTTVDNDNVCGCQGDKKYTMDDVGKLVTMMKDEWGVLSLTDLVFNHTANESPWLQEHPECSYNMVNSPHLKPAYLVDRILWHFSMDVAANKYADQGVPAELRSENHLQVIVVITLLLLTFFHSF